jgi:hypothetical protein
LPGWETGPAFCEVEMSCSTAGQFVAGDAFKRQWQVGNMSDAVPPVFVPYNLTGCVAGYGLISADPDNQYSIFQAASNDASGQITITNPATGSIALTVAEATTETWPNTLAKGALKIVFSDGTAQTVYTEFFLISAQVVDNV